ncbi:hypothetical protein HDF15_001071 [Granulicella mallensis]|jgi:hypothetical protein|uniref:Uncharacterized protein n=1 Tax=Granulicella mallensis TaxID=940614 RepID=A0A7W8E8N8_9BACT|nr:hypothetical protein [Granulicella mallensis]
MSRAFSPQIFGGMYSWGFAPGWDETGLWPFTTVLAETTYFPVTATFTGNDRGGKHAALSQA